MNTRADSAGSRRSPRDIGAICIDADMPHRVEIFTIQLLYAKGKIPHTKGAKILTFDELI
jgi:hypothetical protein